VKEVTISMSRPSLEQWLEEVKREPDSARVGMYLMHNGVVRGTSRGGTPVSGMDLTCDHERLRKVVEEIKHRPGVVTVRVWSTKAVWRWVTTSCWPSWAGTSARTSSAHCKSWSGSSRPKWSGSTNWTSQHAVGRFDSRGRAG